MGIRKKISVEVAYASVEKQELISLTVDEGSRIQDVIEASGILEKFPEINLEKQKVGIFGELRKLEDKVHAGDRVEIYRELLMDPKVARRVRAKRATKSR